MTKTCKYCGKEFNVAPSQSIERKYCSRECMNIDKNIKSYPPISIDDNFERLTVIGRGKKIKSAQYWLCKCVCGNQIETTAFKLYSGHTKSCGCFSRDAINTYRNAIHNMTFYNWCERNNMLDELLQRWDYELNNCNPEDVSYKSNKYFWFKCENNSMHKSNKYKLSNIVNTYGNDWSKLCKSCHSFAQWGIDNIGDDFLKDYWDFNRNIKDPYDIPAQYNNKVFIKCQYKDYHGSYNVQCNNFVNGKRCPFCCSQKVHKIDSYGTIYQKSFSVWSDKNTTTPYEYASSSGRKVFFKCENGLHKDYKRSIKESVNCGFRCPCCVRERNESFLQEKVRLYLSETLGYKLYHEHDCTLHPHNPKTKNTMPFDNEVVDLKLIIEVHGARHYRVDGFIHMLAKKRSTTPEYELEQQKWRDTYKKEYALANGYHYLEIPHWTEKDESYRILIDNKIREILNKTKDDCA